MLRVSSNRQQRNDRPIEFLIDEGGGDDVNARSSGRLRPLSASRFCLCPSWAHGPDCIALPSPIPAQILRDTGASSQSQFQASCTGLQKLLAIKLTSRESVRTPTGAEKCRCSSTSIQHCRSSISKICWEQGSKQRTALMV